MVFQAVLSQTRLPASRRHDETSGKLGPGDDTFIRKVAAVEGTGFLNDSRSDLEPNFWADVASNVNGDGSRGWPVKPVLISQS